MAKWFMRGFDPVEQDVKVTEVREWAELPAEGDEVYVLFSATVERVTGAEIDLSRPKPVRIESVKRQPKRR